MTIRSRDPSAGFGWMARGVKVAYRHPKGLIGGAGFLVVACLLPSIATMPLQLRAIATSTPVSSAAFGLAMVAGMLIGLLLVPLYAGYMQMLDAVERGAPVRATDIFGAYRAGSALRLIGYGLVLMLIYLVTAGIIIAATGGGLVSWYMQVLAAQASHQPPPMLPTGFFVAMLLFMLLWLFMMGFYSISLGQVALRGRSVFGAIRDGAVGALKNLLPLIVFAVSLMAVWIVISIAMMLVILLLALLASLISVWLMIVLIIPLYIAMLLAGIAVMLSTMYQLWRDVCGGETTPAVPPPFAA